MRAFNTSIFTLIVFAVVGCSSPDGGVGGNACNFAAPGANPFDGITQYDLAEGFDGDPIVHVRADGQLAIGYKPTFGTMSVRIWSGSTWTSQPVITAGYSGVSQVNSMGAFPMLEMNGSFYVFGDGELPGATQFTTQLYSQAADGTFGAGQTLPTGDPGRRLQAVGASDAINQLIVAKANFSTGGLMYTSEMPKGGVWSNDALMLNGGLPMKGVPIAVGYFPDQTAWMVFQDLAAKNVKVARRVGDDWSDIQVIGAVTAGYIYGAKVSVAPAGAEAKFVLTWSEDDATGASSKAVVYDMNARKASTVTILKDGIATGCTNCVINSFTFAQDGKSGIFSIHDSYNRRAWLGGLNGNTFTQAEEFHPETKVVSAPQPFYNPCGVPYIAYSLSPTDVINPVPVTIGALKVRDFDGISGN
jgi:hypothetical protein